MVIDQIEEERYNVRARVPNFQTVFQNWQERSENFRAIANLRNDIRYGVGDKATLDLFLPDDHDPWSPVPLHIFIHGGYWQAMDKEAFSYIAEPFVREGAATAIVNYDLCPTVTLFDIVTQIRQVMLWVWQDGKTYGIDPQNIHVSGHSAGGHLLGVLLATDWPNDTASPYMIRSAVALSGLFDLAPLINTTINTQVGLTSEDAPQLSPYGQKCTLNCPVLAAYGDQEGDGFEMQSQMMVDHWRSEGLDAEPLSLAKANHFDVCDALATPSSPVFRWAIQQMQTASQIDSQ